MNYKQDKIQSWQRSRTVIVDNPYNEIPSIQFNEEILVLSDDGTKITYPVGSIATTLADPTVTFSLLNPDTNEVIGEGTYQDAYVILYSIYRNLTNDRDGVVIIPIEPVPDPEPVIEP